MLGLPLRGQAQALGAASPDLKIDAKAQTTCADRLQIMRHVNLSVRERPASSMLRSFPGLRHMWNSCPAGGSSAVAMKAHLAKYLSSLEEATAVRFLTRRMATAAWKDRSDISFLTYLHDFPTKLLRPMSDRPFSSGLLMKKAIHGSSSGAVHLGARVAAGLAVSIFPYGFFARVLAVRHIDLEVEWMRHAPLAAEKFGVVLQNLTPLPAMSLSPPALRHDGHLESATSPLNQSAPWLRRHVFCAVKGTIVCSRPCSNLRRRC